MSQGISNDPVYDAVIRTVAYFEAVGQAWDAELVWRWLYRPKTDTSKEEVESALLPLAPRGGPRAEARGEGSRTVERKYRAATRFSKFLSCLPGVRAVAVVNTLAWEATSEESDVDLFVITSPGCVWLVRLLATVPLGLLRLRPGEGKKDPICLSFFVSDEALNLEPLAIEPEDPYLAFWVRSIVPIVDDGVCEDFLRANEWAHRTLPNSVLSDRARTRKVIPPLFTHMTIYRFLFATHLLGFFEAMARRVQLRAFPSAIKEKMNRSSDVVVNDSILKFHTNDRRREIAEKWKVGIEELNPPAGRAGN